MKYFKLFLPGSLFFLLCNMAIAQNSELGIGKPAPLADHKVEDISGRSLTLNSVKEQNGLLVIFSCNTCPWVVKWENRYLDLGTITKTSNIGMIALNPNERIRDKGESMEDMKKRAKNKGYNFYYALDKDHELADAFGATRTPHVFLFDKDMKLVYRGAIDDNAADAGKVKQYYLKNAIDELVAGKSVTESTTRSLGCTIKRIE